MIAVRGLAVILAADVDEYSRIIGEDNAGVSLRCPSGRMRKALLGSFVGRPLRP